MKQSKSTESSPQSKEVEGVELLPWEQGVLSEWAIVGMNHYHVNGQRRLFVAMTKGLRCIQAEGAPDRDVFAALETEATRAVNSSATQNQDQESVTKRRHGFVLNISTSTYTRCAASGCGQPPEAMVHRLEPNQESGEPKPRARSLPTAVENGEAQTVGLSANPERDWSIGDIIAAYPDGTIVLDDGLTTWNDIRAKAFLDKIKADEAAFDLMDEVQHRMDAVVDAAVAWCESGEEGESVADSFEKGEALSNAVYRLKQLRSNRRKLMSSKEDQDVLGNEGTDLAGESSEQAAERQPTRVSGQLTRRKLDAAVAEHVMGWKEIVGVLTDDNDESYSKAYEDYLAGKERDFFVPHYSTDIAATWQIVERFQKQGCMVSVNASSDVKKWWCVIYPPTGGFIEEYGSSAPWAICRAALQAVSSLSGNNN